MTSLAHHCDGLKTFSIWATEWHYSQTHIHPGRHDVIHLIKPPRSFRFTVINQKLKTWERSYVASVRTFREYLSPRMSSDKSTVKNGISA